VPLVEQVRSRYEARLQEAGREDLARV
jgi:hypothetical protein